MRNAHEVIAAWDRAGAAEDRGAIHPTGGISTLAYEQSGIDGADLLLDLLTEHARTENVRAFDFGCGDGRVLRHLWDHPAEGRHVGADSSPAMLDLAREACPHVTLDRWDGLHHLDTDDRFGLVYAFAVLIHHTRDDGLLIACNLADLVAPGGLLVLDVALATEPTDGATWISVTTWSAENVAVLGTATDLDVLDVGHDLRVLRRPVTP